MKRRYLTIIIVTFILFGLCGAFCLAPGSRSNAQDLTTGQLAQAGEKKAEDAKEKAEEAKIDAASAKKEAEIHKKTVELEKQKADVKLKEAEVAKKEAQTVNGTAKTSKEVKDLLGIAIQKEKEAQQALEKIKIAEEKLLTAQETARIAEEELFLAQERASIAEAKIRGKQSILYKKLLQTGLVLLIGYLLLFILVSFINRRFKEVKIKYAIRKNVIYLINFLIIIGIVFVWLQNINSIAIFFSVIGAGIALALQEAILCIAGWFLILLRRPFEVGDRIELGGVKGDVIDIRLFHTSLLEIGNWVEADQSTGRIVNVPNSAIFKKENYNYNRGFEFIWNEIKILVTFESDWKKAEEIMTNHGVKEDEGMEDVVKRKIDHMTRRYMIHYEKLAPIVYVNIKDSGVELTLRYLTEARNRRATQDRLCKAILKDFEKEEKVNFAYPTYRIVK